MQFNWLGPLKAYMIINLKARGINRGMHKLTRTRALIKKIMLMFFIFDKEKNHLNPIA
jgi:hypothetical protein